MKVREKIRKTKKHIRIELWIPKWIERYNPYQLDVKEKMPSIVGIIEKQFDNYGFAWRINMSYKGKCDQFLEIFYYPIMSLEEFEKLCKQLRIDIVYI